MREREGGREGFRERERKREREREREGDHGLETERDRVGQCGGRGKQKHRKD